MQVNEMFISVYHLHWLFIMMNLIIWFALSFKLRILLEKCAQLLQTADFNICLGERKKMQRKKRAHKK